MVKLAYLKLQLKLKLQTCYRSCYRVIRYPYHLRYGHTSGPDGRSARTASVTAALRSGTGLVA